MARKRKSSTQVAKASVEQQEGIIASAELPKAGQQVVEIVDDEQQSQPLSDTMPKDVEMQTEENTAIPDPLAQENAQREDFESDHAQDVQHVHGKVREQMVELEPEKKEVVEELFSGTASQVPDEISAADRPTKLGGAGSGKSLFIWAVIVLGVAVLVGSGLVWFAQRGGLSGLSANPTPAPTVAPTPTPAPAVSRADITIQVLNGGGVPGAAGKMKTLLMDKGYAVTAVGNAQTYTHEETEIYVKSGKEAYLSLLKEDIQSDYVVGTTSATLDSESPYDAQVIVGKE